MDKAEVSQDMSRSEYNMRIHCGTILAAAVIAAATVFGSDGVYNIPENVRGQEKRVAFILGYQLKILWGQVRRAKLG